MKTRWIALLGIVAVVAATVGIGWAASKYADGPELNPEEFYMGTIAATATDTLGAPSDFKINYVWVQSTSANDQIQLEFFSDCDAAGIASVSGDQTLTITNGTADNNIWEFPCACEKVKARAAVGTWTYFYTCVRYAQTGTIGCDSITAWTQ